MSVACLTLSLYDVHIMIDSHCHLASKDFDGDLPEVLERAKAAGVERMITIADSLEEGEKCLLIANKYDHIFCTIGIHPHESITWQMRTEMRANRTHVRSRERIVALATSSPKVKAIGEIGLDYHYDFSPRDVQKKVFAEQLMIAQELNLPVVVHNRESIGDLKTILAKYSPLRMVLHCCTEKWEDVESLVAEGQYLSFTGIATYPKSEDIRNTIKQCPIDQLMIETDAPYLAPVPHRGKRNEPAFVAEVLKCVAEIKGISIEEVDRVTTENTVRFFGL